MNEEKLLEKLWELSNIVTGFAIVQSLAVTFSLAKGDLNSAMGAAGSHAFAIIFTIVITIGYILAIRKLNAAAMKLEQDNARRVVWCQVTRGRLIAVTGFTVITLFTIAGHWINPGLTKSALLV